MSGNLENIRELSRRIGAAFALQHSVLNEAHAKALAATEERAKLLNRLGITTEEAAATLIMFGRVMRSPMAYAQQFGRALRPYRYTHRHTKASNRVVSV